MCSIFHVAYVLSLISGDGANWRKIHDTKPPTMLGEGIPKTGTRGHP